VCSLHRASKHSVFPLPAPIFGV